MRVGALGNHTTRVGRVVHVPAPFPVVLSIRDRALQVHRELGAPRLARLALRSAHEEKERDVCAHVNADVRVRGARARLRVYMVVVEAGKRSHEVL